MLENRPSSENKDKNPGELTNQNTEQHDQEETQVEKFLSGKKLYLTGIFYHIRTHLLKVWSKF